MDDSKRAWTEVGLRFGALGGRIREHYEKAAGEAPESAPDQAAVAQALDTLGRAVQQVVDSVGDAVKDPAVRDELKDAFGAMGSAMEATIADVSETVGDKVKDLGKSRPKPPEPAWPEGSGDDAQPAADD
jgi:hypothetical protein